MEPGLWIAALFEKISRLLFCLAVFYESGCKYYSVCVSNGIENSKQKRTIGGITFPIPFLIFFSTLEDNFSLETPQRNAYLSIPSQKAGSTYTGCNVNPSPADVSP